MDRALLEMVYAGDGNRHTVRLHVLPVNTTPVGPLGDLTYVSPPPASGSEQSVLDTLVGFAQVWAPYYPDTWLLAVIGVWAQLGDALTVLPGLPSHPSIPAYVAPSGLPVHSTHRTFTLNVGTRGKRRLHLAQVNAPEVAPARGVTPTSGGYDARDQAMIAYLSAATTAAVDPVGQPFAHVATVRSWWDRPVT